MRRAASRRNRSWKSVPTTFGLDVHKNTITVALAEAVGPPRIWGTIDNTPLAIQRLLRQLGRPNDKLKVWYEAGPCGYGLYRQVRKWSTAARSSPRR